MRFIGWLLKGRSAGEDNMLGNIITVNEGQQQHQMTLTSSSYAHGETMPNKHSGKGVGADISPDLKWTGVPSEAVELVLVMEDPSAPLSLPIIHMIATNIPTTVSEVPEGWCNVGFDHQIRPTFGSSVGWMGARPPGYRGPRPLPGHGPHTYVFTLFALDAPSDFPNLGNRDQLISSLAGKVIAKTRLDGITEQL
eukprot:gene6732-7825_t